MIENKLLFQGNDNCFMHDSTDDDQLMEKFLNGQQSSWLQAQIIFYLVPSNDHLPWSLY